MQCKTERCLIRELVPDDWKSMQKIAVDFRKSKYAVYDMPLPVEDAEIIARTASLIIIMIKLFCKRMMLFSE